MEKCVKCNKYTVKDGKPINICNICDYNAALEGLKRLFKK